MGIRVDDVSRALIVNSAMSAVERNQRLLILNVNAQLLNLAATRKWLRELFERADISFCDGAGAQLASLLLTGIVPHRTTPPEWIDELAVGLAPRRASVYWLDGSDEMVAQAASNFHRRHGLPIAGYHHGYFDTTVGSAANQKLVDEINAASPDVLLVTMGMPRQEQWLNDHWHLLNARVAVTAGALVDHVAGRAHRPPRWVANLGLEWLVRLVREPRRLWRRYLIGLPVLATRVLRERVRLTRQQSISARDPA
ncbi:MAG: WecB/TagA/CpsF family glycosyltransferase [Alphaproteobacteria bacterium]|nr:WecB/TagA/CpsF family glycosyltransferase [Alphaproteobacteria bacterium]